MEKKELHFSCLEENYGGLLSPKEVHLFYYDIGFDKETGYSFNFEWTEEIQSFLSTNNIVIDDVDINAIPLSFEKNKIYFSMIASDEGNKAVAFIRHLRNCFFHYHIGFDGNYYRMKDFQDTHETKSTMIGKIEKRYFDALIDIFFKQKAIVEEEYYKSLTPNI